MKKYVSLLLTIALLLSLCVTTSAAVTDTFVDEIPADSANFSSKVVEFSSVGDDPANSHKIAVENNPDLGATLLLKTAAPRNAKWDEYIVYKMDKNIAGFTFDVVCCAGLGNPLEDITVYLSKNGTDWQEVSTQATKYVYDEDIYINFDKAYWHNSTLMNKKKIGTGYKYIKIQFNGCTEANDVPWNIAIDRITIQMGSNVPAPTISAEDKFETYEQINSTKTTTGQPGGNTPPAPPIGGGDNTTAPQGGDNKTTTAQGGNNKTTTAQGGNNKTTTAQGGNNKTTTAAQGGNNKTTAPQGGNNKTTAPQGGNNKTTAPQGGNIPTQPMGGSDNTTAGSPLDPTVPGASTTPVAGGDTTAGEVVDPSATVEGGEVADPTDPSATVEGGEIADPTAPSTPGEDGATEDVPTDGGSEKKPSAWPWIVVGAVVVLGGAGAGVFFFLKKKKA